MSDTNTVVFDQKTIGELNVYNPLEDGEILETELAQGVKFPIYITSTDKYTNINTTKSINIKELQNLIDTSGSNIQIKEITESDFNISSQDYNMSGTISPSVFDYHTRSLIMRNQPTNATSTKSGLMSAEDKIKVDNMSNINNLANGERNLYSLRTIGSRQQNNNYSVGINAFASGENSAASGENSHSQGYYTEASGRGSHTEGCETIASGIYSHAGGIGTISEGNYQTTIGKYNTVGNYLFAVGNGENSSNRSNAFVINQNGQATISGTPEQYNHLTTKQYVDQAIQTHTQEILNNLTNNKQIGSIKLVDLFYPIGSIYLSLNNTSPADLFGGVWKQIEDCFLLTAGINFSAGGTGGQSEVFLTADQCTLKAHHHAFTRPTVLNTTATTVTSSDMNKNKTVSGSFEIKGSVTSPLISVSSNFHSATGSGQQTVPLTSSGAGQKITFSQSISHTHTVTVPSHTHTLQGGAVEQCEQINSTVPVSTMPPYLVVYAWQRIENNETNS